MRRGIREKQYDNRYTNVPPLAPRHLRFGIGGRIDRDGREIEALDLGALDAAIDMLQAERVGAVAICFMNAYASPAHEAAAAERVAARLPGVYLSVSSRVLPAIRFYDRLSTTALNAYVGPILDRYLDQLQKRLAGAGFRGTLLVMQSNGGVISPDGARQAAATTLLSGPAGGPRAGLASVAAIGREDCIVVDMGGTSFEAALVAGRPVVVNGGQIDRLRIALPMLDIHTIGAGGGSIAWLDAGGLLRMGPQSAGADPGPACYGKGGMLPTTTDANVVLGYLDADDFAGGAMKLDVTAARAAIEAKVAGPLGLDLATAAAGMFRIACANMAEGIRAVTIARGHDPRAFPLVVAGGAGPIHGCEIARELDIPLVVAPRLASILCASGMLMSDFVHDYVRTFVARLDSADFVALGRLVDDLAGQGAALLASEGIAAADRSYEIKLDLRYLRQYQEVTLPVPQAAIAATDRAAIALAFHAEHNRLFGYELSDTGAPIEIVNLRVSAVGRAARLAVTGAPASGTDASAAVKRQRRAYSPEAATFRDMPVYDWARLRPGNRISGPALVESDTTTFFVGESYDAVVDGAASVVAYSKGRADLVQFGAAAAKGAPR
jgi:N-methylhydantoinase A